MTVSLFYSQHNIHPRLEAQCRSLLSDDEELSPALVKLLQTVSESYGEMEVRLQATQAPVNTVNHQVSRLQTLEQVVRVMSHNLRAPAQNIAGLCQLITADLNKGGENFLAHVKMLLKGSVKLTETISDLDSIVKVLDGSPGKPETVNLADLFEDVQGALADFVRDVEFDIDLEVKTVRTVKGYLFSILYNLVHNAIKYRKPGKKAIVEIRTRPHGAAGFSLTVKDHGIGLDMKKHGHRIFGLYEKLHEGMEGKGLGLFLVKAHTGSLGGNVTLQSDANGTEITVQLPGERL